MTLEHELVWIVGIVVAVAVAVRVAIPLVNCILL